MKYLVFYSQGDFTGRSDCHKVIEAESPEDALKIILKEMDAWLDSISSGFAPYYELVKVYGAMPCLAEFKGKDKNGEFK